MSFFATLPRRAHRAAQYGAWMGAAVALTAAVLTWVVNTDWFVMLTTQQDSTLSGSFIVAPMQVVTISGILPMIVLLSGFVMVVSALSGGFRAPSPSRKG
jgi:hypothetical protein